MMLSPSSSSAYLRLCVLSALSVMAMQASAAITDTGEDDQPTAEFDTIVVTASRTPTKVENTIAQTRVIDEEELKRFQGQTVLEVLKRQPGFSIKQDGGIGQSSNFYIRGYDSKRVLILIDGIRYGSMSTGQPALSLLPTDQIERVEVLYGASGSSIYGADAMGGVIQIFTKGSSNNQDYNSVTIGAGSHDHYLYGASTHLSNEQGASISLSASRNQTKGISALTNQTGNNKDADGYRSNNFAFNANLPLSEHMRIGANGLYAKSNTEFDDYTNVSNAEIEQENGAASIFAEYDDKDKLKLRLSTGQSSDDVDNKVGDKFKTIQEQTNLLAIYQLPIGQAQAGGELLKQKIDITPRNGIDSYKKNERTIKSGFLGYQVNRDIHDFQANVRYDDNSQFDNETSYNIGYAFKIIPSLRLGTSYATGYRAPSLNDLYVESTYYIPNENLKVENSKNIEIFIESNTSAQTTRLTAFDSDVDNLIDNAYDASSGKYRAVNINEAQLSGYSLTSDWYINNMLFGGQYTYTDAEDRSNANKGKQLVYRPKHTGLMYVGYQGVDFDVRAEAEYVGKKYTNANNSLSIDDYTLFNISGNYYINPNLTLTSRVANLTNVDYATNDSFGSRYSTDGTNFFTSLTYTWY